MHQIIHVLFGAFRDLDDTHRGCSSSRESTLGKSTEDSTSSEAEDSTNNDGSRSSRPLHVLTITRCPWCPPMLRLSIWYCGLKWKKRKN